MGTLYKKREKKLIMGPKDQLFMRIPIYECCNFKATQPEYLCTRVCSSFEFQIEVQL